MRLQSGPRRRPCARASATPARIVSQRDLELLRLVGEQYALTLPQLARLMRRSDHAAVWLRKRWQRAGWVDGRVLLVGRPAFIWLTRSGNELAGLPYGEEDGVGEARGKDLEAAERERDLARWRGPRAK